MAGFPEIPQEFQTSPEATSDSSSSADQSRNPEQRSAPEEQSIQEQIYELEKLSKFKFKGQDYTPQDLEKAILRQQDYTKKTQSLGDERKAFEQERKFYENVNADIDYIKNNPEKQDMLINKFIELYPQKFHGALKQALSSMTSSSQGQNNQQNYRQQPDIDLMNRINGLESKFKEQEVAKNTIEINQTIDNLSKKYSDAIPELVIGRVNETYNQILQENPNAQLTPQMWEDVFKQVDSEMKQLVKTKYGSLVKQQSEANSKSKSPQGGGGTMGRAPNKFKSLKDVTNFAVSDLTGKS